MFPRGGGPGLARLDGHIRGFFLEQINTLAPALTNPLVIMWPMPWPPPVTTNVLPETLNRVLRHFFASNFNLVCLGDMLSALPQEIIVSYLATDWVTQVALAHTCRLLKRHKLIPEVCFHKSNKRFISSCCLTLQPFSSSQQTLGK